MGCCSFANSSNGHRGRRDQVRKGPRYGTTVRFGTSRIIGKGFPLLEGDVISTGDRSFAVFTLTDGTKMTLRPNSVFAIEHFLEAETSAVLKLFNSGFRALTGLIAKTDPKAYLVETPVATIGIRGTKFDARLCDANLNEKSEYSGFNLTSRRTSRPHPRKSECDRRRWTGSQIEARRSALRKGPHRNAITLIHSARFC